MIPMERFYPGSALGSVSLASGFGVEQVASEPFVTRKDVIVKSSALSSPKVLIHVSTSIATYVDHTVHVLFGALISCLCNTSNVEPKIVT